MDEAVACQPRCPGFDPIFAQMSFPGVRVKPVVIMEYLIEEKN